MGYNTACVRRLDSFVQARNHYQAVKPIRGREQDVRPLGDRRHDGMARIEMPDESTVDLLFYGKTFVRWHADDTFEVMSPSYYSAYAPDNCSHFLPGNLRMRWVNCRMFLVHDGKEYLMPRGDVFKFAKVGGKYFFLNKPVAYNYRRIRGAIDNAMQRYVPFLDWLQVVSAVTNEFEATEREYVIPLFDAEAGVATDVQIRAELDKRHREEKVYSYELAEAHNLAGSAPYDSYRNAGFCEEHCVALDKWVTSDNAEDWVLAMKLIGLRFGRYHYQRQMYVLTFTAAFDVLRNIATYLYRAKVFELVRLPDGKAPSRTNEKFFRTRRIPTLAELSTFGRSVR
jgi:hypothetical protein